MEAISRLVSPSEETESVFAAPGGEFEPTSLQELRGIRSALLPESYVAVSPKTEAEPAPDAAPTATPTPEEPGAEPTHYVDGTPVPTEPASALD